MLNGKGLFLPLQRAFVRAFASLPDQERFYLTGGTALAEFYLGHRISYDLDFFTSEEALIVPFSRQVTALRSSYDFDVSVMRRFASYVEFKVTHEGQDLKVDLALDSPFRFAPPVLSAYGVRVNAFEDLRVDKLLAYYGRAEPRDAVDLYFILQQASAEDLLALAGEKDPGFDLYWFAVALKRAADFPDGLDRWPIKMLTEFDPVALKRRFQQWALDLMQAITA
jgi:hypothetical protein